MSGGKEGIEVQLYHTPKASRHESDLLQLLQSKQLVRIFDVFQKCNTILLCSKVHVVQPIPGK